MKMTKLSLIAAMAITSAFAGGDIAPVEPAVAAPVASATTIKGKLVAYYITDDSVDLFDDASSKLGAAATLDVSHKFNDMFTANFTAVGYLNLTGDHPAYFEGGKSEGSYFNVANLTATFDDFDTTVIAGRQLLGTPMLQGYDWLFAPGSFEAVTAVNTSIENVTLVGAYVTKWRENDDSLAGVLPGFAGDAFTQLPDDNWAVGAIYSDAFDASVWYYNVDALDYTQVYVDAGTKFGEVAVAAQYAETDYGLISGLADSTLYGVKVSGSVAGFDLTAAYNKVEDSAAGYVGWNGVYTNSWNMSGANSVGDNWLVSAATEFSGVSATVSYAMYDDVLMDHELNVILGYGVTDDINLDVVYSDYGEPNLQQLEIAATYSF